MSNSQIYFALFSTKYKSFVLLFFKIEHKFLSNNIGVDPASNDFLLKKRRDERKLDGSEVKSEKKKEFNLYSFFHRERYDTILILLELKIKHPLAKKSCIRVRFYCACAQSGVDPCLLTVTWYTVTHSTTDSSISRCCLVL